MSPLFKMKKQHTIPIFRVVAQSTQRRVVMGIHSFIKLLVEDQEGSCPFEKVSANKDLIQGRFAVSQPTIICLLCWWVLMVFSSLF